MTDIAKETFLIVIEYRMLLGSIKKNDSIGDDTNKKNPGDLVCSTPMLLQYITFKKKQ
jgi:hypothetical protein